MPLLIATILGARPQFIKAAPVSFAFQRAGIEERILHTGQHYDANMSDVFFERMNIPQPTVHLDVGSACHGAQTGRMLEGIEKVLLDWRPDAVLVYGDTNSTLAGALAATKLHIPIAHVEAGLRSFNRRMPEETNRVLTDHMADLLFVPTEKAAANLASEGITLGIVRTGDVMLDASLLFRPEVEAIAPSVLNRLGLKPRGYAFATVHRAENTDDAARWQGIVGGLKSVAASGRTVVWPLHPRVKRRMEGTAWPGFVLLDPLPYFETQALVMNAAVVLTDSGGLQKEAAFYEVPCVTLRDETEWVELVEAGVNTVAGADCKRIVAAIEGAMWPAHGLPPNLYGDGCTSGRIAAVVAASTASPIGSLAQRTHGPNGKGPLP